MFSEKDSNMNDIVSINSNQNSNLMDDYNNFYLESFDINQYKAKQQNDSIIDSETIPNKYVKNNFLDESESNANITEIKDSQLYFHKTIQNPLLNSSELIQNEEERQNEMHIDDSEFVRNMDNNIAEKNEESEENEENDGNNPKKDNEAKKIILNKEENKKSTRIECAGKKRKRSEEEDDTLFDKNNNINSKNEKIFGINKIKKEKKEINLSVLKSSIFQIICDSAKKVSPAPKNISIKNRKKSIDDKRITSFEKKMKINLKETLDHI